jgi:hypothetical protein
MLDGELDDDLQKALALSMQVGVRMPWVALGTELRRSCTLFSQRHEAVHLLGSGSELLLQCS